jgi:DNA polymerase-3 subunit epsilon
VHGISLEELRREPRFPERIDEVRALFAGASALVGYNVRFDLDMIQAELRRAAAAPLDLQGVLLLDPFRLWQRSEPRSLADAHRRFVGGDFADAHSAGADVAATARVLGGMVRAFSLEARTWEEIATIAEPERLRWIGPSGHLQWDARGEICLGFGKHAGRALADFVRGVDGRSYVQWMLGRDFPPHVHEVLDALRGSKDHRAWREQIIARYGPPPGPEAFGDDGAA